MIGGILRLSVAALAVILGASSIASARQPQGAAPKKVNLNTATAADLQRLPGIGLGLAQRIVAHREKNGPFRTLEELLIVRGINRKKFEVLRPLLYVDPPTVVQGRGEKPD